MGVLLLFLNYYMLFNLV